MPERISSDGLMLPDGRKVRVLSYDDGSVRFRLDGTPYVLEEAFLAGGRNDHAIVKLAPKNAATVEAELDDSSDPLALLRAKVATLKTHLDLLPEPLGAGRIITKHKREALDSVFTLMLSMIDDVAEVDAMDE